MGMFLDRITRKCNVWLNYIKVYLQRGVALLYDWTAEPNSEPRIALSYGSAQNQASLSDVVPALK